MKTSMKTIVVSILAAAALVASGTAAQAGEAGAAGSVSLQFNTNFTGALPGVTGANTAVQNQALIRVVRESSSIAVGKNGAASSATSGSGIAASPAGSQGGNVAGDTITSAIGTGGTINVLNAADATLSYIIGSEVVANGSFISGQGNTFTAGSPATISRTTLTLP